jgi:hypothetical protein
VKEKRTYELIKYIEITVFMLGLCFFFVGMHNIDISQHMARYKDTGTWNYDLAIGGQLYTSSKIYMVGVTQCFVSLILFFGSKLLSLANDLHKGNYYKSLNPKI